MAIKGSKGYRRIVPFDLANNSVKEDWVPSVFDEVYQKKAIYKKLGIVEHSGPFDGIPVKKKINGEEGSSAL